MTDAPLQDDRALTERERIREHADRPEAIDKLGDPAVGRSNPGRCHVCLAWTLFPYGERSKPICPECHGRTEAQRERVRTEVRETLREHVWGTDE